MGVKAQVQQPEPVNLLSSNAMETIAPKQNKKEDSIGDLLFGSNSSPQQNMNSNDFFNSNQQQQSQNTNASASILSKFNTQQQPQSNGMHGAFNPNFNQMNGRKPQQQVQQQVQSNNTGWVGF